MITPEHDDYNTARAVWNGTVDRRPRVIARCGGTADVAAPVRFARDQDLDIAVRGGGHNVGGSAVCDGGIVIDLSAMRAVSVDPVGARPLSRAARCGDVDYGTQAHGLATTGGIVSHTGLDALQPHRAGVYVNFLDSDDDMSRVHEAYGDDTYRRLAEVKTKYDPENVFHNNKNLQPWDAGAVSDRQVGRISSW